MTILISLLSLAVFVVLWWPTYLMLIKIRDLLVEIRNDLVR